MPKRIELKTAQSKTSVSAFVGAIEDNNLRADTKRLLKLFKDATGATPRMWGASIIGFGTYTYHRSNGDEGQYLATGFSPRKSGPTIYIMPGYADYSHLLSKLGPHKLGKSCLYLKRLSDVDQQVLKTLIKTGIKDLKKTHDVVMQ